MQPAVRVRRAVFVLIAVFLAVLVPLSFDWRFGGAPRAPELVESFRTHGALRAGTGRATLTPPQPTALGGYNTRGDKPFTGILDEPEARAVALEAGGRRVVLASAELVVIPSGLRRAVLERLGEQAPDAFVLTATHTHTSVGGYWNLAIAEWIGLGSYDPRIEAHLADRIAEATRQALASLAPAQLAVGQLEASNFAFNRAQKNGPVDGTLTAVRIEKAPGEIVARVVVFAAHPTILHRDAMQLSADWPGAFSRALESNGGLALLFQGAVGDLTWGKRAGSMTLEERVVRFGGAVAADARGALVAGGDAVGEVDLAFARARIVVPEADAGGAVWGPFEGLVSNLFHWLAWPGETEVSYLEVGPLSLAFVPGEVVSELGLAWRPALEGAAIVSLADDYVGYVESPELFEREEGESQRCYFCPALAPRLLEGLQVAKKAAEAGTAPSEEGAVRREL